VQCTQRPAIGPTLSQMNPINIYTSTSYRSILILSSHLRASSASVFRPQFCTHFWSNAYALHVQPSSSSLHILKHTKPTSYWLTPCLFLLFAFSSYLFALSLHLQFLKQSVLLDSTSKPQYIHNKRYIHLFRGSHSSDNEQCCLPECDAV
jgi:hypothetical protein